MLQITIISVGKLKEKYLLEGIKEYSKRLSKYTKLTSIEVPDEQAPENLSFKDMELVKIKEGKKILSKLSDSFVITLVIDGNQLSSTELATKISDIQTYHASHITFIIGGSLGLSDEVIQLSNFKLSFSKMTFPHQLMKLILLEQIYRSLRILNNEPYHK
jgi:23S rRNA (pseudouridine1915-N3)-methyltransferase